MFFNANICHSGMSCIYGDIKNVILVLLPLMQVSMPLSCRASAFVMPSVGEASDGLESQSLRVASLPQDSRQCASLPQDDRSGFTWGNEAIQENCINLLPFYGKL